MEINRLIEIAEDLNLHDKVQILNFYKNRLEQTDKDLILPLVGEFSSGKTTLLNSLLDNPNLETASRATTASIFEIHFGSQECHAEITTTDGLVEDINDVGSIKNDKLKNVSTVKVFDTSNRIGASTILVDTPGLSSNTPEHRIALSSYLPNADAILLLTDVNQQLTRSLLDFIQSAEIINKPIYLLITKCDTKSPEEVEKAKDYIKKSIEFEFADIITISATTGKMNEFDNLIGNIQARKNIIVEQAINNRIDGVAKEILCIVNEMLQKGSSTEDIDRAISAQKNKLERFNRNIRSLLEKVEQVANKQTESTLSQFNAAIFSQIDGIVQSQGRDCDQAVYSAVNSLGSMMLHNYQRNLIAETTNIARIAYNSEDEVPVQVLETINLSDVAFNGFSYNVDLSSVGHKLDKTIGYAALGVAATVAVVATMGAAAPAVAGAAGTAAGTGTIIAADAATDMLAAAYTTRKISKMQKAANLAKEIKTTVNIVSTTIDDVNQAQIELGQKMGMDRGFIETTVSWVTDFFAKPARQKAVHNYIDGTLIPEFRTHLINEQSAYIRCIGSLLNEEAVKSSDVICSKLNQLKEDLVNRKEEHQRMIEKLSSYTKELC